MYNQLKYGILGTLPEDQFSVITVFSTIGANCCCAIRNIGLKYYFFNQDNNSSCLDNLKYVGMISGFGLIILMPIWFLLILSGIKMTCAQ